MSIILDNENYEKWSYFLNQALLFLSCYNEIIDAFVLDFFIEDLWLHLPRSWRCHLELMQPHDLAGILNPKLFLRATTLAYCIPRIPVSSPLPFIDFINKCNIKKELTSDLICGQNIRSIQNGKPYGGQHRGLHHVFRRHVKPKKQHEVSRLACIASYIAKECCRGNLVDIGSGQGHLARLLTYGYGVEVHCLDSSDSFIAGAKKFDEQLEKFHSKQMKSHGGLLFFLSPNYSVKTLGLQSTPDDLFEVIDKDKPFGLVGLHTCGDLGPTLIRLFTDISSCKALLCVGCCYMKITLNREVSGYPLSAFVQSRIKKPFSYEARDLACHALELFSSKLLHDSNKLKVHSYRATLEKLIMSYNPQYKHMALSSVNNAEELTFKQYAKKALSKLESLNIPENEFESELTEQCLSHWMKVVTFYTVRLMTAPVVEAVILLDRLFYLYEKGFDGMIAPVFDPELSPRNCVLFAVKSER